MKPYSKTPKLRLLKDIPGYKAGTVFDDFQSAGVKFSNGGALHVGHRIMIEDGFAELVDKDDKLDDYNV